MGRNPRRNRPIPTFDARVKQGIFAKRAVRICASCRRPRLSMESYRDPADDLDVANYVDEPTCEFFWPDGGETYWCVKPMSNPTNFSISASSNSASVCPGPLAVQSGRILTKPCRLRFHSLSAYRWDIVRARRAISGARVGPFYLKRLP